MALIDFIKDFPDEESCKQKLKRHREQVGVTCRKCGGTDHYWKQDKEHDEVLLYSNHIAKRHHFAGSKLPIKMVNQGELVI